jgi:hypothetical protein
MVSLKIRYTLTIPSFSPWFSNHLSMIFLMISWPMARLGVLQWGSLRPWPPYAPVSHSYGIQWEFLWMVDIFLAIFHQTYGKYHGKYINFFLGWFSLIGIYQLCLTLFQYSWYIPTNGYIYIHIYTYYIYIKPLFDIAIGKFMPEMIYDDLHIKHGDFPWLR